MSDERKNKPVLDEQSFSKLLEAAYVLQEHNREMQAKNSRLSQTSEPKSPTTVGKQPASKEPVIETEYGITLAKIVETQHDIQVRQLDLGNALRLVASRVVEITNARGAAVGIVAGNVIRYRAVAGGGAPLTESAYPPNQSLCGSCLKTGNVFRCGDVSAEGSLDYEACKKRGIGSVIAAPIFHEGKVVGGLELYYPNAKTFTDQDVHTCRLMAGLVTESLVRDEELSWKKSLADERAAMLQALEKLQPNLAALIDKPRQRTEPASASSTTESHSYICRKCGHELVRDEQFCGQCGTPRASDYEPPSMQSKLASLWQLQESHKKDAPAEGGAVTPEVGKGLKESSSQQAPLARPIEENLPEFLAPIDDERTASAEWNPPAVHSENFASAEDDSTPIDEQESPGEELKPTQALVPSQVSHQWRSASSARALLEKLTPTKHRGMLLRLWTTHRGDVYLAIAVILVASVVIWGLWSDHSSKAKSANSAPNAAHHKSPDADLSFFDRVLIQLGLAEAPPVPEDKGNPSVQVWVDLQTALYYCAKDDLYGKTPKGKFATQRSAQLDQFEPAYRKACR